MPRNVFKFSYEKGGIENAQNIEEYRNFVKDYINTRASSGQFVNCKILEVRDYDFIGEKV